MKKTYYDLLGVPENANDEKIRVAYRRLVMQYHPDRNPAANATEMFIKITRAYECLSDPVRRASYDRLLRMEEQPFAAPSQARIQPPQRPTRDPGPAADIVRLTTLLNRSRYAEAEILARRLVQHYPTQPIPYAVLGDICRYRGDLKEAAKLYAYAAQMDPASPIFQRKHEEMLLATTRPGGTEIKDLSPFPLMVGTGIVIASGAYVALSKEAPIYHEGPISEWFLGLIVMLFLCGVSMGASLTLSGALDRFWAYRGPAVMRFPPSLLLGVVALANFWAAVALYLGIGASQNAFNPSATRIITAVGLVTAAMTLACVLSRPGNQPLMTQTLLWGGNVVYLGALCGWMVADGFRT